MHKFIERNNCVMNLIYIFVNKKMLVVSLITKKLLVFEKLFMIYC